ncbi:SMI1/KNR4 family protein [Parvibium lacunae]|uniref:SMI1/KNR4 family protein n=1 Tax=Parvibium lacunae TaxID=1888893 RepID=A0A368KYA3_9BURK|nr:SMI1/KNR4 family protein [Parvibium lacunae]RCS56437.1 SMI1/KNR4 family protein [Parvibium lacunae]
MDENLLKEFAKKDGAAADVIAKAEAALQWPLPTDYKEFLEKANGGEGFIGENYLILWTAEELAQFNNEYEVQDYAPGLVLFGSDGGGEGYAFDARTTPAPIVQVPFIGMDLMYARQMAGSFSEFVSKLAEKS